MSPKLHKYLLYIVVGVGNLEYNNRSEKVLLFDIQVIAGLKVFPAQTQQLLGAAGRWWAKIPGKTAWEHGGKEPLDGQEAPQK